MKFSCAFCNKLLGGVDSPSFLVALVPTEECKKLLAQFTRKIEFSESPELEPAKELHLTLRYWKKEQQDDQESIKKDLEKKEFLDSKIRVPKSETEYSILGDKGAFVIKIHNIRIDSLQKEIDKILQKNDVPPSDFSSFKAHVTLAYGIKKVPEDCPELDFDITFDSVRFTDNTDKVIWIEKL